MLVLSKDVQMGRENQAYSSVESALDRKVESKMHSKLPSVLYLGLERNSIKNNQHYRGWL